MTAFVCFLSFRPEHPGTKTSNFYALEEYPCHFHLGVPRRAYSDLNGSGSITHESIGKRYRTIG